MNKDNYPEEMPAKFKPIRPWGYVGYIFLYSIPIVGLVFMIMYALSDENINRRNFARCYLWVILISFIILFLVFTCLFSILGVVALSGAGSQSDNPFSNYEEYKNNPISGFELYKNAEDFADVNLSEMQSIMVRTYNARYELYIGDSISKAGVKSLIELIESHNADPHEVESYGNIVITGDVTSTDDVTVGNYLVEATYGSSGYINSVKITKK